LEKIADLGYENFKTPGHTNFLMKHLLYHSKAITFSSVKQFRVEKLNKNNIRCKLVILAAKEDTNLWPNLFIVNSWYGVTVG